MKKKKKKKFATKATLNSWTFTLCMAVSKKSITLRYILEKIKSLQQSGVQGAIFFFFLSSDLFVVFPSF
jgi:hypothetical protein